MRQAALTAAPHRLALSFAVGGQEQFYLEGQVAYALPAEDGGIDVWCSTQHPTEMQHVVAHALARPAHAVQVRCRRMGGGFGGKESQSALFACVAAVAAWRLQRPVKLRPIATTTSWSPAGAMASTTTWTSATTTKAACSAPRRD
jgi:xanthine dehydrogenase large subunit